MLNKVHYSSCWFLTVLGWAQETSPTFISGAASFYIFLPCPLWVHSKSPFCWSKLCWSQPPRLNYFVSLEVVRPNLLLGGTQLLKRTLGKTVRSLRVCRISWMRRIKSLVEMLKPDAFLLCSTTIPVFCLICQVLPVFLCRRVFKRRTLRLPNHSPWSSGTLNPRPLDKLTSRDISSGACFSPEDMQEKQSSLGRLKHTELRYLRCPRRGNPCTL